MARGAVFGIAICGIAMGGVAVPMGGIAPAFIGSHSQ